MNFLSLIHNGLLVPLGDKLCSPTSLAIDSRKIEKGGLFVAIPGYRQDGSHFIGEALQRGAVGVVVPQGSGEKIAASFNNTSPSAVFFETAEIRKTASILAAYFYPLQPETVVAVTGTNGKTSVVSFIRQIWHHLGLPAASLGTLGLVIEGRPLPPPTGTEGINTPDPVVLHQLLQSLEEQGIQHLAFEATSHALSQHRLDSVRLKAALFTNFSNDHLDYHHTLEAYYASKMRLFEELMAPGTYAILNADIAQHEKLLALCKKRNLQPLSFGEKGDLVRLLSTVPQGDSQDVSLKVHDKVYTMSLPLVGKFQVYNVMAALSAVIACEGSIPFAVEACSKLKGVPGRLEKAAPGIYVDYAHTPDGLSLTLQALRSHTKGKLWVVFGCGGDRDSLKRPMMGEIATKLADVVIVTDDNPRHEDPAAIRKQVLGGCSGAIEIPSRGEAIRYAIEKRQEGDVILIAGKGHEMYQLVGDQAFSFDDREEVRKGVAI